MSLRAALNTCKNLNLSQKQFFENIFLPIPNFINVFLLESQNIGFYTCLLSTFLKNLSLNVMWRPKSILKKKKKLRLLSLSSRNELQKTLPRLYSFFLAPLEKLIDQIQVNLALESLFLPLIYVLPHANLTLPDYFHFPAILEIRFCKPPVLLISNVGPWPIYTTFILYSAGSLIAFVLTHQQI